MGSLLFLPLFCNNWNNDKFVQVGSVKVETSTILAVGGAVALVAYIALPIFKERYKEGWLQRQET